MPIPSHGKSVLQTPDPFHVPGYLGYCPQVKYRIGNTFGATTHKLLTDKNVASSQKLVLSHLYPEQASEWDELKQHRESLVRSRTQSWGDQKLKDPMVPGYTGFVPKGQHYFGKRYRENTFNAMSDFEQDQRKHRDHLQGMRVTAAIQTGQSLKGGVDTGPTEAAKYMTPLRPVSSDMAPYVSPHQYKSLPSVYKMSNEDPNKHRMSGYTGFVPRSRSLLGMGYPVLSHEALNNFTDDSWRQKSVKSAPVQLEKEKVVQYKGKPIYPVTSGLVPHYTGHVKGEKFRFGQTFGHSTENCLQIPVPPSSAKPVAVAAQ